VVLRGSSKTQRGRRKKIFGEQYKNFVYEEKGDCEQSYIDIIRNELEDLVSSDVGLLSDKFFSCISAPLKYLRMSINLKDHIDVTAGVWGTPSAVIRSELILVLPFMKDTMFCIILSLISMTILYYTSKWIFVKRNDHYRPGQLPFIYYMYKWIVGEKQTEVLEAEVLSDLPLNQVVVSTAEVTASMPKEEEVEVLSSESVLIPVLPSSSVIDETLPLDSVNDGSVLNVAILTNAADNTSLFTASLVTIGSSALFMCFF